jgi:hypothetical protein
LGCEPDRPIGLAQEIQNSRMALTGYELETMELYVVSEPDGKTTRYAVYASCKEEDQYDPDRPRATAMADTCASSLLLGRNQSE